MASKANFGVAIASVLSLLAVCGLAVGSDPSLVSWWEFDAGEGATAYDSIGINHGTIYGAQWTSGQIEGALDFDGDDGVYLEPSAGGGSPLNIYNTDLTISSWVKVRGTGGTIVARAKPLYITYRLGVSTNKAYINTYKQGPGHWILYTDEILDPDVWYHIVGVFDRDGDKGRVYVDGVEEAWGGMNTDPLSNDAATKIGCRNNTGDAAFDGTIDDVRIYGRVLSTGEVWQLYQEGSGGLVAHWEFDEGSGTTATDSVGGNNGVIYGAEWTDGQIGGALSFDGDDDYVEILHTDIGNPTGSFTISAWAKLTGTGTGGPYGDNDCIVSKHTSLKGYFIEYNWESSIGIRGGFGDGSGWRRICGSPWELGDWHFVVLRYDAPASTLEFFDNAVSEGAISGLSPQYSGRDLRIGSSEDASQGYQNFPGVIDEVAIYDRALSAEEIRQLYQNGSSGRGLPVSRGIAVDNIERAIREKVEAWKKIDDMLEKERQAYEALEQMLRTTDYGNLSYSDIVSARYEIYTAIEQGERSKEALERSIENLEAALAALGFELVPKASAWLEQAKLAIR